MYLVCHVLGLLCFTSVVYCACSVLGGSRAEYCRTRNCFHPAILSLKSVDSMLSLDLDYSEV